MLKIVRPTEAQIIMHGHTDYFVSMGDKLIGDVVCQKSAKTKRGKWIASECDGNWKRFLTRTEAVAWIYHKTMTYNESVGAGHGTL